MHESEIEALALDALGLVRNELLVSLRFMSAAFARLAPLPIPGATLATDGAHLRFDPVTWARTYAADPAEASRAYLHTVLHCVFLHLYPGEGIDPDLWDIACDMVVESVIDQLDLPATRTPQAAASRPELERMAEEAGLMTAERVYAALRDQRAAGATDDELARLGARFHVDDHRPWHAVIIAEGEDASGKTGEATEGEGRTSAPAAKADTSGTDMDIPDEAADVPYSHKAHRAMDAADITQKDAPENAARAIGERFADTVQLDRSREQWENAALEMGIQLDAYIPKAYIEDMASRIDTYKKIAAIQSREEADDLLDELIDRFSDPPAPVVGLVDVALLRNQAANLGVGEITQREDTVTIRFVHLEMERVARAVGCKKGVKNVLFNAGEKPFLQAVLENPHRPIDGIRAVLNAMSHA